MSNTQTFSFSCRISGLFTEARIERGDGAAIVVTGQDVAELMRDLASGPPSGKYREAVLAEWFARRQAPLRKVG